MKVPFYKHQLGTSEINAFSSAVKSEILTTGNEVFQFEDEFSQFLETNHSIAVQSCTAGLQLCLEAYEFKPDSEVITTPLTYIATALSILQAKLKPVFCDVDPGTGNIDIKKIENYITSKTVAIMPVHLYGQMVDMVALNKIAKDNNLVCIEDSAHCVEGRRENYGPGSISNAACFSFYATKNITCGEGGCITTNSAELANKLRMLRSHGVSKIAFDRHKDGYSHWELKTLGWKYNLDNLHASILRPQLPLIKEKLQYRESAAVYYEELLKDINGVKLIANEKNIVHARHLFPIRVPSNHRDKLIKYLQEFNIGIVVNYRSLNNYNLLLNESIYDSDSFTNATIIGDEVLSLPMYPQITKEEIEFVVSKISNYFKFN